MYSQKMYELGTVRSVIRELFEYGKQRAAKEGADKVFDFSLGNPSIPAPQSVEDTIMDLVKNGDRFSCMAIPLHRGTLPSVR